MPSTKKLPEIDLKELERFKKKNQQEREEFHMYIDWLKAGNERGERDYRDIIRELKLYKERQTR
jgi:hypothetical protein